MRRRRGKQAVQPVPRRVVVMSPQTRLALARRAHSRRAVPLPIFDTAAAGVVYRRQLRLALLSTALLAGLVLGIPLLLSALPVLGRARLAQVPVAWVLLGAVPFPLLLGLGWAHLRSAERAERGQGERG